MFNLLIKAQIYRSHFEHYNFIKPTRTTCHFIREVETIIHFITYSVVWYTSAVGTLKHPATVGWRVDNDINAVLIYKSLQWCSWSVITNIICRNYLTKQTKVALSLCNYSSESCKKMCGYYTCLVLVNSVCSYMYMQWYICVLTCLEVQLVVIIL